MIANTETASSDRNNEQLGYNPNELELELYQLYRPNYQPNLSNLDIENQQERKIFWNNVAILLKKLEQLQKSGAKKALIGQEKNPATLVASLIAEIKPKIEQFAPLNDHLLKVTNYAQKLSILLVKQIKIKTNETSLTERELVLISDVVAPLHDIIKHLSKPAGQISTDHQVVIQHILTKYNQALGLSKAGANFAAAIAGDHENANTVSRSTLLKQIKSEDGVKSTIAHGKIIFYLADTFTEVINTQENSKNELEINLEALQERFKGILDRWNDPLITPNMNPKWALLAYTDYEAALTLLEKNYGLKVTEDARLTVLEMAIMSFRELITRFKFRAKDQQIIGSSPGVKHQALPIPSSDKSKELEDVVIALESMAQTEKEKQKQTTLNVLITRLENLSKSLAVGELSEGLRLARVLQSTYEIVSDPEDVPDDRAKEISELDYQKVEKKFQAFNIVSVNGAINLIYHYLKSPAYQEKMLEFFKQFSAEKFSLTDLLRGDAFKNLTMELAAYLHNQYAAVLGDGSMWSRLDSGKDREKKEKSYIVAAQLLSNIINYLADTKLPGELILSLQERNLLRETNFQNGEGSDIAKKMKQALSSNQKEHGIVVAARATHEFWRAAKRQSLANSPEAAAQKTDKPERDPPEFDALNAKTLKKNQTAAAIALENMIRDLSREESITAPLKKLAKLIDYLFKMIQTPNNLEFSRGAQPNLANWAEMLTTMQYNTWLMNELTLENGLDKLVELGAQGYFSVLQNEGENTHYVKLNELYLSYKDLDRVPLLMAAITLFLRYHHFLLEQHNKFLKVEDYQEDLRLVSQIAKEINFVGIEKL